MVQTVSRWVVLVFLATMPWAVIFFPNLAGHDLARIFEVLVCTICGLCLAFHLWVFGAAWSSSSAHGVRWWLLPLRSVGALALVSTALAPVLTRAAQELLLALGLVAVSLVFAAIRSVADTRLVSRVIVISTLTYNLLALLVLCGALLQGYGIDMERLPLGYENRRFFNHVQTVSLSLLLVTLHRKILPQREAAAAWVALATGFSLLLLSGGRGTLMALVGSATLSLLWLGWRDWWVTVRPLAIGLLAGSILFVALFVLLTQYAGVAGIGAADLAQRLHDSSPARQYLWSIAIDNVYASPWFGIGPMHFAYVPNMKAAHPHNIYLQIAAEWGIPLLLLVLAGSVVGLWRMIRSVMRVDDPVEKTVGGSLILACIAICIDGFVSGNFVMPVSQVWIAVCIGMAMQWKGSVSKSLEYLPQRGNRPQARLLGAMLVLMMLIQSALLAQDIGRLEEIHDQSAAIAIGGSRCPRFWVDGWIVERS